MANNSEDSIPGVVYFDGACPVCSKEINALKGSCALSFVDIHELESCDEKEKETLLRDLHVKTSDGSWLSGVDANIYMWKKAQESGHKSAWLFSFLSTTLSLPVVYQIAKLVYRAWANKRYRKLYENNQSQI